MSIITNLESIKYTWRHKGAFLKVEKMLCGKNTIKGYLHDMDKVFLYLIISHERAHNIHTKHARHHKLKAKTNSDYIQMVIDWECARITKPDKPLNARETLYKFYPDLEDKILPILDRFNL